MKVITYNVDNNWIISSFMDLHANIILGLQYISKYYSFDIKNYRIKYYVYKIWKSS